MNDDAYTRESGHIDVGSGHKIYYQKWGNPKANPIFVLHGGPGSQSKDKHKLVFDPLKHCVIFHDQRGCGQSISKDPLAHNTIDELVADIEKLRIHLGYDLIQVYGFSWGSTLALYYAVTHTKRVTRLMIGGVFTATKAEIDHVYQGGLKDMFPEAWERFVEVVPVSERHNTIAYYHYVFTNGNEKEKLKHLQHWSQLEPAPMSIDTDYSAIRYGADTISDFTSLNEVLVSIHYMKNNCFIPDKFFQENLKKLKDTPTVIVQGRFDLVCMPQVALRVARRIGESAHIHFVPASHKPEGSLREVIKAYLWSMM